MNRSISTAIALTLGIAVSAAVVVTVLAQKKQPSGTSSGPDRISAREAETPSDSVAPRAVVSAPALALAPASSSGSSADAGSDRAAALLINASGETGSNSSRTATPSEIEVDSSNIRMVPKSSVQPIAESRRELRLTSARQENSLAAALLDPSAETVPVWRPAYSSQGFRGARLDAFAISQDSSVLAIAERTGKAAGPNGTRIILVDTSDWQVIRILTTDRSLKKMAFIPGRAGLAAVAYPQPALKQQFGLLLFDLKTGTKPVFRELPFPFNEKIDPDRIALLPTGDGVFCSGFFDSKVFYIPHDLPEKSETPYFSFETVAPASALAVTPDGKNVAAVSQKAIEFFNVKPGPDGTKRLSITTLDLGWAPVYLRFLGGADTDFILCPAYREDSPPVIIRSSARDSLDGRSVGYAVPMEDGKLIGVAFKVKGRIDVIDPATLDARDSVILEQLRPNTTGDTAFVFYLDPIRAFCVVDTVGNCFAVGRREGERHWMKRIIWNGAGKR